MPRFTDKGLIAKKIGMTRVVDEQGDFVPVTLLQVEPQKVTKVLDKERDGYCGYQVGYATKKAKSLTKADVNRLRKVEVEDNFSSFCEFRTDEDCARQVGELLNHEVLKDTPFLDITGLTKGRGFQGAVKRWNSSIGRMTHGSRFHRRPGSLGQCTTPGRVFKNKKQPGHMGTNQVTLKNLQVVRIDSVNNLIAVKGSVPGHNNSYLKLVPTNKK